MILIDSAPWLLIGFALATCIHLFISKDKLMKFLGYSRFGSVFLSSLIGVPLPLCSCGVLPTAVGLRKSGANRGATLSFLISTPTSGVDSIAYTWAMMGPLMAITRPIVGFVSGTIAGVAENLFDKDWNKPSEDAPHVCSSCSSAAEHNHAHTGENPRRTFKDIIKDSTQFFYTKMVRDMALWLIVGIVIAGIIGALIPSDFFENLQVSDFVMMLIMLVAGIPMYICASASVPIGVMLLLKGVSPGAVLVFLFAGPATNITSFLILKKHLGKIGMIVYYSVIVLLSLGFGYLLNLVYYNILPDSIIISSHITDSHMPVQLWQQILAAAAGLLFIIAAIDDQIRKAKKKKH